VDVLAVLDEVRSFMSAAHPEYDTAEKLRQVRAAVEELSKAAAEYLDADDLWNDDEEPETSKAAVARNAQVRRWKRLSAALARVRGES
jgi:hypothetical protein